MCLRSCVFVCVDNFDYFYSVYPGVLHPGFSITYMAVNVFFVFLFFFFFKCPPVTADILSGMAGQE